MSSLHDLLGNSYKRATFYFPKGDQTTVEEYLKVPNHLRPGEIRDIHFKYCGHKLKKSAEFEKFVEESVPSKFQSRFAKSEKGIDIEICCDALRLASMGRLERLFLLTNDGDFLPLCRTLREFGSNISVLHLSEHTTPNVELIHEVDSYDVIPYDSLNKMFFPEAIENNVTDGDIKAPISPNSIGEPESEKPEAAPSDLDISDTSDIPEKE